MENAKHTNGPSHVNGEVLPAPRFEAPAAAPFGRVAYGGVVERESDGDGRDGSLLEYGRMLARNKAKPVIAACLGMLAGFLLSLPQTPIYQGRTTLEIESLNENFFNLREVNPTTVNSRFNTEFDIATQVKILQSRALVGKVVDELKLDRDARFSASEGRFSAWKRAFGLGDAEPVPARERAIEAALASFSVEPSRRTRIVEIVSEWPDPDLAAAFSNTLADTFIEHNLEARWMSTRRSGEWLSRQLDELRVKLEKSEERLQRYARQGGLLFTGENDSVAEQRLAQLQAELSQAQADRISKQSRFELARSVEPEALPDIVDNTTLRGYQVRLTELRRELAELDSRFTPAHHDVKSAAAQVGELEGALEKERSHIIERIRNDYEIALRRERLLADDYANQAGLVSEQAGRSIQYNIYKREVDTNRDLYDNLLKRVKEAGVASATRAGNIRIVDRALPPRAAVKPDHRVNSLLGLLGGLLLGVAFVIVSERADRTLRQPGDVANYLRVPELGVIPSAAAEPGSRSRGRRKKPVVNGAVGPAGLLTAGQTASGETVELTAWQQKPTLIAESFRAALTSILFAGANGSSLNMLVVSSPSPGEGKTTVVTNLAICLSEINRRVLLIDADMRKPRVHKVFNIPNTWGLSDLLRGSGGADEDMPVEQVAVKTGVSNLYVLPSGTPTLSIPNLLHSPRTTEVLARCRREFDTVLIDTPPMMQISDARVLGRMADAVVLVLRAGQTTRDTARAAAERFLDDGTHLLGTILNSWNPSKNGYGYYDSYRYYDGYYGDREESEEGAAERTV